MKENQKFTPKYWICHDPNSDDVFLGTASKGLIECLQLWDKLYKDEQDLDFQPSYDLFEIKLVL